jgi:hypothetical protein
MLGQAVQLLVEEREELSLVFDARRFRRGRFHESPFPHSLACGAALSLLRRPDRNAVEPVGELIAAARRARMIKVA